jgi:hypothetical protein
MIATTMTVTATLEFATPQEAAAWALAHGATVSCANISNDNGQLVARPQEAPR